MAIISQIRNNSWVLVVLIGLGLAGFLFMDMFSGDTSAFGAASTTVGSVNGESIEIADLNRRESVYNFIYRNNQNSYETKDFLWNHMVEENILKEKASALGMGVGREELMELQFGQKLSPVIQSRFSDPNTRQVNRENLEQVKQAIAGNQLSPDYRQYWAYQETEVIKQQLEDKYKKLISQAIYTPTWMGDVNKDLGATNKKVAFVKIPFDQSNLVTEVSDEEINNYISENKAKYFSEEETRRLAILDISVVPTSKDSMQLLAKMNGLKTSMSTTDNLSLFVDQNEGLFDDGYFLKEELNPESADSIFSLEEGEIYGPFIENGSYQLIKLVDKMALPDSVKSRHILIRTEGSTLAQAQSTADSLKTLIEAGTHRFDSLAVAFGTDGTAAKGGDLGYASRNQMVKEFNDLIFYTGNIGKLYTVQTRFGVHLVEILDRKYLNNDVGVKIALINEPIVPSEATQDQVYEYAQKIMRDQRTLDDLRAFVSSDPSLILSTSRLFDRNAYNLPLIGDNRISRDVINWAFSGGVDPGDVREEVFTKQNTINYFNSNYYIIALDRIQEKGLPSAGSMREDLEVVLLNKKRGEDLLAKVGGQSINQISAQFSTPVDTAFNVNITSAFIPKIGNEPNVLGMVHRLKTGDGSKTVVGNDGVYCVEVVSENPSVSSLEALRSQKRASYGSFIRNNLMNDIKKNMDISDNRSNFY